MYQIISMTGEILSETDSPVYSKFNPENKSWISASEFDADCVVVDGKRCVLYGKTFVANSAKVVFVKKIDATPKIKKIAADTAQISIDTLDVIEAVIEIDRKLTALTKTLEELKNG